MEKALGSRFRGNDEWKIKLDSGLRRNDEMEKTLGSRFRGNDEWKIKMDNRLRPVTGARHHHPKSTANRSTGSRSSAGRTAHS